MLGRNPPAAMVLEGCGQTMKTISGVCRVCGCTENSPCVLPLDPDDDPERPTTCAWMDEGRTLCSNLRCVAVTPLDELAEMLDVIEATR